MFLLDPLKFALRLAVAAVPLVLFGIPAQTALGQSSGTVAASTEGQAPAESEGRGGVEAGVLTCNSIPGTRLNLLIHSSIDVNCTFETADGKTEQYTGDTGIGLGVDLNWDRKEKLYFSVVSAGADITAGAYSLAGRYLGGKASITAGLGVGAAALIGGSDDNIALQPLALETSSGLGLSGGMAYLFLEPAR